MAGTDSTMWLNERKRRAGSAPVANNWIRFFGAQVALCLSRDPYVCQQLCAKFGTRPHSRHVPFQIPGHANAFPPSGFIPFHGWAMYGTPTDPAPMAVVCVCVCVCDGVFLKLGLVNLKWELVRSSGYLGLMVDSSPIYLHLGTVFITMDGFEDEFVTRIFDNISILENENYLHNV